MSRTIRVERPEVLRSLEDARQALEAAEAGVAARVKVAEARRAARAAKARSREAEAEVLTPFGVLMRIAERGL